MDDNDFHELQLHHPVLRSWGPPVPHYVNQLLLSPAKCRQPHLNPFVRIIYFHFSFREIAWGHDNV
jgi:hypothetical protein